MMHALDLHVIASKIFDRTISKARRKVPTYICKVCFVNNSLEIITVHRTFRDPSLEARILTDIIFYCSSFVY